MAREYLCQNLNTHEPRDDSSPNLPGLKGDILDTAKSFNSLD